MISMYLDPAPDYHFTLRNTGGPVGLRVSLSHLEIREMLAGNAAVMACAQEGRSYTLFSGAVSECIREADELNKHYALPVRAPSLAPKKVILRSRRQFFSGTWVSYTSERIEYPRLDLAVMNLNLAKARVTKEGRIIVTAGTLRRHCFTPADDSFEQTLVWQALTHRIRNADVASLICTPEGNWCPRCLSRHVLLKGAMAQCLHCLHESHHHAHTDSINHGKKRPLD